MRINIFSCSEFHVLFSLYNVALSSKHGMSGADTGGVDRVDIHPPIFQ